MKTDLNHRERDMYARQFTEIAETYNALAEALRIEDDGKAFILFITLNVMIGPPTLGLSEIFHEVVVKEQLNRDLGGL